MIWIDWIHEDVSDFLGVPSPPWVTLPTIALPPSFTVTCSTVTNSNKVRLGNTAVTVIEGQVMFSAPSDKTKKENFQPVDGEEVQGKIRGLGLSSWNFIGHDPKKFRHYGPMAQDFYTAPFAIYFEVWCEPVR